MSAIDDIFRQVQEFKAAQSSPHGSQEQRWIAAHVGDDQLADTCLSLSIIAFHVLSALEGGEQTGATLADQLQVTRGGVTRAAKKLVATKLITANKHEDDQKKIYYALTDDGLTVAKAHDSLHQEMRRVISDRLSAKYSEDDLKLVASFLGDLTQIETELNQQ